MVEHERVCVCVYVCIVCSMMKMMIGCAQEHFFFLYLYKKFNENYTKVQNLFSQIG